MVQPLQPVAGWIHSWACNEKYTPLTQLVVAFVFGILLSPWSSGIFFLVVFIIIYEWLLYVFTHGNPQYWSSFTRCAVICGSVLGYIVGRTLSGDEILVPGVPGEH